MPLSKPIFLTGQNLAFDGESETVPARLTAHARTMEQGVYQVAEHFYVAVGYGNANMTMVVGTDGVILIDSMENAEAAREALADLRRFSDKPVKALIYTHSHPDHSSGSRGLLDPAEIERGALEIYAHERLLVGLRGNPSLGIMPPLRLAYSFGWDLARGADGWARCCAWARPASWRQRRPFAERSTSRQPASACICARPRAKRTMRSCCGSRTTVSCIQRT